MESNQKRTCWNCTTGHIILGSWYQKRNAVLTNGNCLTLIQLSKMYKYVCFRIMEMSTKYPPVNKESEEQQNNHLTLSKQLSTMGQRKKNSFHELEELLLDNFSGRAASFFFEYVL
jgi:hypothetical protein